MTTVASRIALDITPLTGFTGAEIRGVDLHQTLAESTVADILAALVEYKVIFFPGQHLSSEEHLAFAAQCGEITEAHPISRGNHGHPGLHEINYSEIRDAYAGRRDPLKKPRLDGWHTDVTFMETPPMGSILNALAMPERGGDTVFANTEAAYEGLSAPFQQFLDGLVAVHDGEEAFGEGLRKDGYAEWDGQRITQFTPVEHPLVRTPGERKEEPLRQPGVHLPHQGVLAPGKRRHPGPRLRAYDQPEVPGALPLDDRRSRILGQPGHHALHRHRLRHPAPPDPARHPQGRTPVLIRRAIIRNVPRGVGACGRALAARVSAHPPPSRVTKTARSRGSAALA